MSRGKRRDSSCDDPIRVVMTAFFSPFLGNVVSPEGLVFVCLLGCELGCRDKVH